MILENLLKHRNRLTADPHRCERFRSAPATERDKFVALEHHKQATGLWEVCESIVTEPASECRYSDEFSISLLIGSAGARPAEFDRGLGRFLRPNQPGTIIFADNSIKKLSQGIGPFHSMLLLFQWKKLRDRCEAFSNGHAPSLEVLLRSVYRDAPLQGILTRILESHRNGNHLADPLLSEDLLDAMIERVLIIAGFKVTKVLPDDRLTPYAVNRGIELMRSQFHRSISRDELATSAGVDTHHFTRLFRQTVGETPMNYLRQIRVENAQHLLSQKETLPLSIIAERCGFCDSTQFGKDFKKLVGMTPARYRRLLTLE